MFVLQARRWFVAICFCLLVTVILGSLKYSQIRAAIAYADSFPEPSARVEAVVAETVDWQPTASVIGTVVPTRSLDVRNELAGNIEDVGFASGGVVKNGQLILRLNTDDEQAQLDAIEAEVQLAKLDLARYQRLDELNLSSREQYDRATAQLAVAEANARALKAVIQKKTLIAPFDATAGLHQFEVGSYLAANSLVTRLIGSLDQVWIDFAVPQDQAQLAVGTTIVLATKDALGEDIQGEVIAKDAELSSGSRNVRLRALVNNTQGNLVPGAVIGVTVPYGQARTAFRLPADAVRYEASGPYVHILVEDGEDIRAVRQIVEIVGEENQQVLISGGLEVGQLVATLGSFKLRDGLLVSIAPSMASEKELPLEH